MTAQLKNGVAYVYRFFLVDATDDETPETGQSPVPSVYLMKSDETSFTAADGTVTECAQGWYTVTLTTGETDTDGDLCIYATGTGTDRWNDKVQVYTPPTGPYTVTISDSQLFAIADTVWRRSLAHIRASSVTEALVSRSPIGMLSKFLNRVKNNTVSGELEVYEEDDSTLFFSDPVTTVSYDSAAVITEINPSA